ncbi:hypothetical protein HYX14_03600 [Candidatus Woesearchaeota archaeon]|nr:hypothetical protein [Candidatus Woesearchaeota archaeon]
MIRKEWLILITLFFLLVGCSKVVVCNEPYVIMGTGCCLDQNGNNICDKDESNTSEEQKSAAKKETSTTDSQEQKNIVKNEILDYTSYNLNELKGDLNSILGSEYSWEEDSSDLGFYNSNHLKLYAIQEPDEGIISSQEFYERFSAKKWTGYLHFLNQKNMGLLQPELDKKSFSSEEKYREYIIYRITVEQTIREKVIDVGNGKVMEYQLLNWKFDNNGYFEGVWENTLLIYKIYCSPDKIIYIRPGGDMLGMSMSEAKRSEVYNNWESTVLFVRKKMLNLSNRILQECPVDKDFFSNFPENEFKSSKTFYYYKPVALEQFWKLSTDVSAKVGPAKNYDGNVIESKYTLEQIDIIFNNNDAFDIQDNLFLDIKTIADSKEEEDFVSEKKMGYFLKVNEPLPVSIDHSLAKPQFSDNLSIHVSLYVQEKGKAPIRPTDYVLFTNNTLVKK